jgi:hypothetical protein
LHDKLLDRLMLANVDTGLFGGDAQSVCELAVIDLMIFRRKQRAGDFACKPWLARACRRGRKPFERQSELTLEFQMMRNRRLIVGGQRNNQRAFGSQLDIDAGRALEFFSEGWPAPLAFAPKRDERFLARLGLGASRQHAGGSVTRAGTGFAAIEHRDGGARGEPPANAEPDHARTDDNDARLVSDRCDGTNSVAQCGSLRWYDPDRFDGCDLSRTFGAAPLADAVMMVIFAPAGKRRFPRRN